MRIRSVKAREILDSRGNPTVEADVVLSDGSFGRAAVPSGASTGAHEALELRDGGKRYLGKGVEKVVRSVNAEVARSVKGRDFPGPQDLDNYLIDLDGTPNKSRLGANGILSVSNAFARAQAARLRMPLYQYLRKAFSLSGSPALLPVPMMNVLNGGLHADSGLEFQEFMILPAGAPSFREALRMGAEIFHTLKKRLAKQHMSTAVGDEGGFAPRLGDNELALKELVAAIRDAGYKPGKQVFITLDPASSSFYKDGAYRFRKPPKSRTGDEMIALYKKLCARYPIISIEDGLAEDDWSSWRKFTALMGRRLQIVGDDLFVTQKAFLEKGIREKAANAILIKLNQVGSLTETMDTIMTAQRAGFGRVVSHRSGETEDAFIADLVVAAGCGQIKTGSACRSERIAKYNQLMRIEEESAGRIRYAGLSAYRKFL